MKKIKRCTLAFACALAATAHAEPGGTSGVTGVIISQGALKVETRTALFEGGDLDGDWLYRAQASYGVTDWWRTQVNVRGVDSEGRGPELRSVAWGNAVDFTATRSWPVRLGGQFRYRWGLNGASDGVEFKLLAQRRSEDLDLRFNIIGGRDVGGASSDEWEHGYATRAMWTLNESLDLGFEGFGEFDVDQHAWGPRASFALGPTVASVTYLSSLGAGAEADGQLRLSLEFAPH